MLRGNTLASRRRAVVSTRAAAAAVPARMANDAYGTVHDVQLALAACHEEVDAAKKAVEREKKSLAAAMAEHRPLASVHRAAMRLSTAAERLKQAQKVLRCLKWQLQDARRHIAMEAGIV